MHRSVRKILRRSLVIFVTVIVVYAVVVPLVVHHSPWIQRSVAFARKSYRPEGVDYTRPEKLGIKDAVNFYLSSKDGAKIGVWHLIPKEKQRRKRKKKNKDRGGDLTPIFVYLHGNTGSRATDHRIKTCELIRGLGYHVLSFDYRGFGDSSDMEPTESGALMDARAVFEYARRSVSKSGSPVFLWGHSLGSSIAISLAAQISAEDLKDLPLGLILESPFNNIADEIKHYPLTSYWRTLPWFDWAFSGNLGHNDLSFATDRYIANVTAHILILHARDDPTIPFELGLKLYKAILDDRRKRKEAKPVEFVEFREDLGYGHLAITSDERVPEMVREFVRKAVKDS